MKYLILIISLICFEAVAKSESYYVNKFCKGEVEYVLHDKTRVDCLTDEYAIEFDFSIKWAESIGQSLHYAYLTNKKPGIVLIVDKKDKERYLTRLNDAIGLLPKENDQPFIKVWVVDK